MCRLTYMQLVAEPPTVASLDSLTHTQRKALLETWPSICERHCDEELQRAAYRAARDYIAGRLSEADAGAALATARQDMKAALAAARQIATMAVADGRPEKYVAIALGVDRMTVRKWCGK